MLTTLARDKTLFYSEISKQMNEKVQTVRHHARRLNLGKGGISRMGEWNNKHAQIRVQVMTYFLNHSAKDTWEKFKLTESEFKSLMTVSYTRTELKHLRKDKRRRDAWTTREYKFMIQHSGLMSRDWIAKKLKRGGTEAIRGKLEFLQISSRTLNGITISQFRQAFQKEPGFYLKTKAGPGKGKYSSVFYKIIPWVYLRAKLS